jgi:hypothetical protein
MSNSKKVKPAAEGAPVALGKGRYAIFQNSNGDGVIAYRPEGEKEDSHQVIPAGIWKIILSALRGEAVDVNPMTLMKMLMGK